MNLFYFSHKIFFANFEFIFAIKNPELATVGEGLEHTLNVAQNRVFFTFIYN